MKFELSKEERDIIIRGLHALSREVAFKGELVSGKPVVQFLIKIINKLKRGI